MIIHVRLATGKVMKFALADGWGVEREGDDLVVRWHRDGIPTDRVHIFAPGYWREFWIE